MYSASDISSLVQRFRSELGLSLSVTPKIADVCYDESMGTLTIIAEDRPDKSAILGPGGWVLKKLRKELNLNWVGVKSKTDLEVKKYRVNLAINRLNELSKKLSKELRRIIAGRLLPLLKNELKYPKRKLLELKPIDKSVISVAFSGGVDSSSALIIASKLGLQPISVSINPGAWILPPEMKEVIDFVTSKMNIEHKYVEAGGFFKEIFNNAIQGRIHPCGKCHEAMEVLVSEFAEENDTPIISFGDLLPTGNYSSYIVKPNILRFNIVAAIALTKTDTIGIARSLGHPGASFIFGCPFLRKLHKKYPHYRWPSIQRVVRETRAGVLEPNQALEYIKGIIGSK
jgi:predicted PP-loop superfamily ATPase